MESKCKFYALKFAFAVIGGAVGGALAFLLSVSFGYAEGRGSAMVSSFAAAVVATIIIDPARKGVIRWSGYTARCALFAFLLITVLQYTASAIAK